jgi:predicted transcriptional regulator of viral defense system
MIYYNKIINLAKENNGIVTSRMIKEESIPSIILTRMVRNGMLMRIERGIYSTENVLIDDYYILYQRNPKIVFSYTSALFLNELTDRIPYQIEITLPNNYNSAHITSEVIIHKVLLKYYYIGQTVKRTLFGNDVVCYDMERTICDLVRFRHKIDTEIFSKALKAYINHPMKNLNKLRVYGKEFRINKKINEILDLF